MIIFDFRDAMSSSSNDELDMTSPSFNPTKALYSKNVKMLSDTAQPLDNISKFELTASGEVKIKAEKPRVIIKLPV
jgi:hypothetical protein